MGSIRTVFLKVLPAIGGDHALPLVSPEQRLGNRWYGVECRVGTDIVGFVFLFFLVPASVPTSRLLLSGHHLVSWLFGSHLHRTYLLDGLILSSYFSGLVVSCVLVPVPPIPLWPGFQGIPGWASLPRAGCTSPARLCHLTRSVCLAPQPTVSDILRSGEGSHSHLPVPFPRALG